MSTATAGSFKDHPRKVLFRRNWAKPILEYLNNRLNKKLIYLGLPGIKALDILEWKEFLRIIIAFQAENYDGRTNDSEAEAELDELLAILNDLETKGIIETYALYTGYIEQVVMSEEDERNEPFVLSDYVTVYNLDFCNTLSKPFPIVNKDYSTTDCFKIDVIDKLLSIEKERYTAGSDGCFAMFLTVNSHFVESMVSSINHPIIKQYISKNLKGITGQARLTRLLKAYTFYKLNEVFAKHGFHVELLPAIYYKGSGSYYDKVAKVDRPYWLITFTVLGTPVTINDPVLTFEQDFQQFLEQKFIFINDSGISCYSEQKVTELDYSPDIASILSASSTLTKLWVSD